MAKRRMIPFSWMPGSWGLKGKTFEKAKAEYELEGYDLEIRLSEIEFGNDADKLAHQRAIIDFEFKKITDYEMEVRIANLEKDAEVKSKQLLEIDHRYNKISEYEFDKKMAEYIKDEDKKKKQLLEIEHKHNKIDANEYGKQLATLEKRPWVAVVSIGLNKDKPATAGELELDWNEFFVTKLRQEGHIGPTDYAVVEQWFNLFCAAVAAENGIVANPTKEIPGISGEGDSGIGPGTGLKEYF